MDAPESLRVEMSFMLRLIFGSEAVRGHKVAQN